MIAVGAGLHIVEGGNGADRFVFGDSDFQTNILALQRGADTIEITGGAEAFSDLLLLPESEDAPVVWADTVVLLAGVGVDALSESDFVFT